VDWSIVVLVLGVLVLGLAAYFRSVLRDSGGEIDLSVGREGVKFKVTANQRNRVRGDLRAVSVLKGVPVEDEIVDASLRDGEELYTARALWIDNNPDWNIHERRMLERLHVDLDLARSTDEALRYLVGRRYQFIITDLTRPDSTGKDNYRAGLEFLHLLADAPAVPPILVYAGQIDERASEARRYGAQTVTAIPSELLEGVVDVLRS
jgi:CheY-like chemotaxis protein